MNSSAMKRAGRLVDRAMAGDAPRPIVLSFVDEPTNAISYLVYDEASRQAAIIDSVRDFDPVSGRTAGRSVGRIAEAIDAEELTIAWQLETHIHADHLSAAPMLRDRFGGRIAIGDGVTEVRAHFEAVFDLADATLGFDILFDDGAEFAIGGVEAMALHVPGHTPADVAYVIGDTVFVGDTLFMPDSGTARADFPGGDAHTLYRSIQRLLELPDTTRMFVCHDYKAGGRADFAFETTVAEQRRHNIHVGGEIGEAQFVAMREARDATLSLPRLILPSIQVNLRGGRLPEPDARGLRYLRLPLDHF